MDGSAAASFWIPLPHEIKDQDRFDLMKWIEEVWCDQKNNFLFKSRNLLLNIFGGVLFALKNWWKASYKFPV